MKTAVLLLNLGTPSSPQAGSIRRWLRQFLSDPRVVELPRWLWLPILHLCILPLRPRRLAAKYASIWGEGGSPLLSISQQQQQALQAALPQLHIDLAMRYGQPDIASAMARIKAQNCTRLLVFSLYPQYSATTSASNIDAIAAYVRSQRRAPELRFVSSYHDDAGYIEALASSVRRHWAQHGRSEKLLMSFHGLPQRCTDLGDPYAQQCQHTARLLAQALQLQAQDWQLCYQSRLGYAQWLQPYTAQTLQSLATQGLQQVDVICPGFAADCLETLEEISQQNRELFMQAGGKALNYVPALNADPEHIHALKQLILRHTQGWN